MSPDRILERLCRVQAFAVLIVVALAYPLAIDTAWLAKATTGWSGPTREWFFRHFLHWLTFSVSPLTQKEALTCIAILVLLLFFVAWTVLGARRESEGRRVGWMLALVGLAALSAFWLSPVPYFSLKTWTRVACASGMYFVVASLARRGGLLERSAALVAVIASVLAAGALLQHFEVIPGLLIRIEHHRNRMGSLIGHNTGLSVYLVLALFPMLAVLFGRASGRIKTLTAALAGVMVFVLVLAQSRSVWLLVIVLTPVFAVWLRWRTGIGPKLRHWGIMAAVGAVIVLSQVIESPLNVAQVRQYPLLKRLRDLAPSQLKTETRLRIPICSWPLIQSRPLLGHGLGSFQQVYAKAQRDYYVAHPFMWIAPASNRTNAAHNDYLQLMIEGGLVGLLLFLCLAGVEVRRGWRTQRAAIAADARGHVVRLGLFFSLVAIAIQGALDFPAHIIPLSLTSAFLLAVWSSAPLETPPLAPGPQAGGTPPGRAGSRRPRGMAARPALPPAHVAAGAAILACAGAGVALGARFFGAELSGDLHRTEGMRNYNYVIERFSALKDEEKTRILSFADYCLKQGRQRERLNMEMACDHAQVLQLMGQVGLAQAERFRKAGDATRAEEAGAWAASCLGAAISYATECLKEFRNHLSLGILGAACSNRYRLKRNPDDREGAFTYLEMAAEFSPAYAEPIYQLAELYAFERVKPERVIELRAMIARYDPPFFHKHYMEKAYWLLFNQQFRQARDTLGELLKAVRFNARHRPDLAFQVKDLTAAYLSCLILTRMLDQAEAELEAAQRDYPDPAQWLPLVFLLRITQARYEDAIRVAREAQQGECGARIGPNMRAAEAFALVKAGAPEARARLDAVLVEARQNPSLYTMLGDYLATFTGDADEAIKYYDIRLKLSPRPDAHVHGQAALMLRKLGRNAEALRQAREALAQRRDYDQMRELIQAIESGAPANSGQP